MKTEISIITDNNPSNTLKGEWGLCLLIKYNHQNILVDAGASNLFLTNMEALGEKVEDVDMMVLSHAHYDHANGIPAFFEHNTKAKLYVRESTAADCYMKVFLFKRYIGIPKTMMLDYKDRIEKVSNIQEVSKSVYLVPHSTKDLTLIGKREKMYRKTSQGWTLDDFSHEQSLVLETDQGLLIVNSCSHGGVENIIHEVKEAFPDKTIYGYIGGFHLYNKTSDEVKVVAEPLKELEYVCTGHCTGDKAYDILKGQLGGHLHKLQVGLKIEI